ncbi:DUF2933 domain-containing protein [Candidatus Falkowbacteria bacterium]|nr:DUF2933 domain-containing protein [Candidatus Falkowbacteria bacterium]
MAESIGQRQAYRKWGLVMLSAVGIIYLLNRHQPHLNNYLPYVILLACPLLHLLMHKNHNNDKNKDGSGHHH